MANTERNFEIIKTLPGGAPLKFREIWIGTILPIEESFEGKIAKQFVINPTTGVSDRKNGGGYVVSAPIAFMRLLNRFPDTTQHKH